MIRLKSFNRALWKAVKCQQVFWISYVVCFVIGLIVCLSVGREESFLWVNQKHNEPFDYFFRYITWLGDGRFYLILIGVSFLYRRYWFMLSWCSFVGVSVVSQGLKHFLAISRPAGVLSSPPVRLPNFMETELFLSFPSGHATVAFSIACAASMLVPSKIWSYVGLFFAILVAYSRIYLAKHWLVDVVVGSFIGMFGTLLIGVLLQSYLQENKRFFKKMHRPK